MILNCNSCGKKFVVPDSAITASGRTVQCGSCGNKWKQFPVKETAKTLLVPKTQRTISKSKNIEQKPKKVKKNNVKKQREINLYSPEYLAKKHGIKLNDDVIKAVPKDKVSFGFYNSLLLFLIVIIVLS